MGGFVLHPTGQSQAAAAPAEHAGHLVARKQVTGVAAAAPPLGSLRMPVPNVIRPMRAPDGADVYRIPIQPATAELLPGHPTAVRTYAGQFVGPTIRARTGRPVRVTYTNRLDGPANVHLHGGHNPAASDGHPMDIIEPGRSRTYTYPNRQQGATLWYHDHAHHLESENVYFGLHGFYILQDDAERRLNLPSGEYDVPIMIKDVQLDADGALVYPAEAATTLLANGVIAPRVEVAARKYRFRLLNGSNERTFRLTLAGAELTQIASDGGLLPAPKVRSEIVLSSAERADVVIDFSQHPVGSHLVLYDISGPVLRFDVTRKAADTSRVPAVLRPLPALPPATVEREVVFSFDMTGTDPVGLINGQPYDPNRVDFEVKRGTTEIWTIRNADVALGAQHTFHLHLEQFRVLDHNGAPPTPAEEGRKDTIFLAPGDVIRVQTSFTDYVGTYVYHCHFLYHSVLGMMAQLRIVP
ncbi:MAG TPA: multicopper oxidase domain-containing protein [Mycobacteriales bacterium]|nr:multicopper oxidase domain-containing protein [Mycobacteriales bacterium]